MKSVSSNFFFINNIKINNVEKNRNIIDYIENLDIKIPHYCYYPKLSVSGNCRMCLVELKNSPKPLVSCAMIITNKMEIYTDSPLVKKSRENVLEFLLLNHPLDCPICDQGGECDLQDQSMVFGINKKRFYNYKRSVTNKNLGPIVKTVMTRCIHCTRCVRFAKEIAGVEDLGMFGRGYKSEIGTYVSKMFDSELSGNIIDICPVGALTVKPYSFVDRNWELTSIISTDFSDSFGLNINVLLKTNSSIAKIQPYYNKQYLFNNWISNKTRFSFDGMFSPEKLTTIGFSSLKLKPNSWGKVFKEIINILFFHNHLNNYYFSTNKLTFLVGESLDLESLTVLYLLKKKYSFINICKLNKYCINCDLENNFLTNFTDKEIFFNKSNFCILIGVNPRFDSPSLNIKLKQRVLQGNFKIYTINSVLDLTYKYKNLGNSVKVLKSICEGNHYICQELINSKNPLILYNPELIKKDSFNVYLNHLYNSVSIKKQNWLSLNCINKTLTESNINYINSFTLFKKKCRTR